MKIRIMAGAMAKLHSINKQTLIYYDKIGLFRPESTDGETGYRYYSLEQAQVLEVILILKQFGMPLKEIRGFLDKGSTGERIALLQKNKTRINATITNLKKRLEVTHNEIAIKHLPQRHVLSNAVAAPYDDYQLELAVRYLLGRESAYFFLYGFPRKGQDAIILYDKVSLQIQVTKQ